MEGDLIPDGRLLHSDADQLEHAAIARSVAEVALATASPTNIALFGPWGSGKSSLYTMIAEHIALLDPKSRVVRYDAWKYGGRELKRHFITSVASELGIKETQFGSGLISDSHEDKLDLPGWLKRNFGSLILGLLIAVVLATIWVVVLAFAQAALMPHVSFAEGVSAIVTASGTVFGLALAAIIVGPKVLEGAVVRRTEAAPVGDDQFTKRFKELIKEAKVSDKHPLVVFIDELDRCDPQDVVATLIDLKTFLDEESCVFIVAVDRAVIEEALSAVPQAKPVRGDAPYYATRGAFLDKIFQHQISLPPLRQRALTNLARALVQDQGGLWSELRENDATAFSSVIFALVPVHVRSPRRVKVLLNAYATNVRIAQGRGIDWRARASEIAVLTVLQTEFPAVATELVRIPRLLEFLRHEADPTSSEVKAVVSRFDAAAGSRAPDGELLVEEASSDGAGATTTSEVVAATTTSQNDLAKYLAKVAAARIPDPRLDLVHLQAAGHTEGLPDPRLGDAIDFAADTAPDRTVEVFADQVSAVLRVAVPLLVLAGEQASSPGREFAYEAACRLVELMDVDDVRAIADDVTPTILLAVTPGSWPAQATPGAAALAATAAGRHEIERLFSAVGDDELDDDLLTRLANALPHFSDPHAGVVHGLLARRYAAQPAPLHDALRGLPPDVARRLWHDVAAPVTATVGALEVPEAIPADVPTARGLTGRAVPQAPPPQPTGFGRQRVRDLVGVAQRQHDGGALVAAVLQALLGSDSEEVVDEAQVNASAAVELVLDDQTANELVITGLAHTEPAKWYEWRRLIRDVTPSPAVHAAAVEFFIDSLLPLVESQPVDDLATLTKTSTSLAPLLRFQDGGADESPQLSSKARITDTLGALYAQFRWGEFDAAEPTGWKPRREAIIEIKRAVDGSYDQERMATVEVLDVTGPVSDHGLTDVAIEELLHRLDVLEPELAHRVSEFLDEYDPQDGELLAVTRLRLRARRRCSAQSLRPDELVILGDDPSSTEALDDWLARQPSGVDVAAIVPHVSPNKAGLARWAKGAGLDDRTAVWIELESTHALPGVLTAVGGAGVSGAAVAHMAPRILSPTKQADRDEQMARLLTAILPDVSREASELVLSLLQTNIGGDARLAYRLVGATKGLSRNYQSAVRDAFDEVVHRSAWVFTASQVDVLRSRGLATVKRKRFGRRA